MSGSAAQSKNDFAAAYNIVANINSIANEVTHYFIVGDVCYLFGNCEVDVPAANIDSIFTVSLPFPSTGQTTEEFAGCILCYDQTIKAWGTFDDTGDGISATGKFVTDTAGTFVIHYWIAYLIPHL